MMERKQFGLDAPNKDTNTGVLLADLHKDVDGYNTHKGDAEEPNDEEEAGVDERDTSQPEADVPLGEKGIDSDREVGYSALTVFDLYTFSVKKV